MTSDREIRVHWRWALALAAMLCAASPLYGQEPISVGDMSTPESALHDPEADVYLVSNINGGPGDRDDNGFISRVSPDGQVLDLKWIDGADPGVTLHAPRAAPSMETASTWRTSTSSGGSTGPPVRRSARGQCRTPAS